MDVRDHFPGGSDDFARLWSLILMKSRVFLTF